MLLISGRTIFFFNCPITSNSTFCRLPYNAPSHHPLSVNGVGVNIVDFSPFLILRSSSIDFKVQQEHLTPCSSSCISHASRSMLSLLCGCCCRHLVLHAASGDKLWMQRKSCKICCIFHYLHVKGHKSSSVKSAIKK